LVVIIIHGTERLKKGYEGVVSDISETAWDRRYWHNANVVTAMVVIMEFSYGHKSLVKNLYLSQG